MGWDIDSRNTDKKDYILERIDVVLNKLSEVESLKQKFTGKVGPIFPDNWIEVQDVRDKLEKFNKILPDQLRLMNYYFAEALAIEESIKVHKKNWSYIEYVEWKVLEILEDIDDDERFQTAIYFVKDNVCHTNGKLFTIEESASLVDMVRNKHGIKKPETLKDAERLGKAKMATSLKGS